MGLVQRCVAWSPNSERSRHAALDVRGDPAVTGSRGAVVEAGELARNDRDGAEEAQDARREAGTLDHVDLALQILGELVDILAVGILRDVEHVAAVALESRRQRLRRAGGRIERSGIGWIGHERADNGRGQQQRNAHDKPPDVT
ncbi:hypothetical protein ACVWZZ_006425 [Bradyrhizobium sp. LM6.10]